MSCVFESDLVGECAAKPAEVLVRLSLPDLLHPGLEEGMVARPTESQRESPYPIGEIGERFARVISGRDLLYALGRKVFFTVASERPSGAQFVPFRSEVGTLADGSFLVIGKLGQAPRASVGDPFFYHRGILLKTRESELLALIFVRYQKVGIEIDHRPVKRRHWNGILSVYNLGCDVDVVDTEPNFDSLLTGPTRELVPLLCSLAHAYSHDVRMPAFFTL